MNRSMTRQCWTFGALAWFLFCEVVLSTTGMTSTVYFRQQSGGSIFSMNGRDGSPTEMENSSEYSRFVGLALHRRNGRIFWSDGRSIQSANAVDGSNKEMVIGALVRVVWVGANFGQTQADLQLLKVKETRCESIISWSPERIECIVGLPQRFMQHESPFVSEKNCSIQTVHGSMTGYAPAYDETVASGTSHPVVERVEIDASFILPHALAIDDREDNDWLYWSNSFDGVIYRSSLKSNAIEALQRGCWSVRGLALSYSQEHKTSLFFSLESKGTISQIDLSSGSSNIPPSVVLVSGLRSPRGLAIDCATKILFFTEKTGRIFQMRLGKSMTVRQKANIMSDDASIVTFGIEIRRIVTRTTVTRLDGIAVDSMYLYWCETNTNVIARALRRGFQRQVLVGGTANSLLSWPRGIVLGSDDGDTNEIMQSYYYSEYTGRVSRGAAQIPVVNAVGAPSMQYLDSLIQQSSLEGGGDHMHLYALE